MTAQWLQLLYSLLICFGGGTLVFLGISEATGTAYRSRKAAAIAAALLILLGGIAFFVNVGKPEAAMRVATNAAKGSPKSLEFVSAIVGFIVAAVYAVIVFRADAYAEDDEPGTGTAGKIVGIVALLCGIAIPILSGNAAAVGRAAWAGWAIPLAYLGSALAMGSTLFASVMSLAGSEPDEFRRYTLFACGALLVQAIAFLIIFFNAPSVDALIFWGGAFVLGTVVPIACLAVSPRIRALTFAALAGSVAGGICIRLLVTGLGTTSLGLIANAASRTPIH